jgi:hypothetical protein
MGIRTDIFVASQPDAETYCDVLASGKPLDTKQFERVQYEGFTPLEFGTLWAILEGRSWDVAEHQLEHIEQSDEGESWLERFPKKLVERIAGIAEEKLGDVAEAWGATEELECDGAELLPMLRDLRKLASAARTKGQSMYLWGSI